jgi:hypothetical protein
VILVGVVLVVELVHQVSWEHSHEQRPLLPQFLSKILVGVVLLVELVHQLS